VTIAAGSQDRVVLRGLTIHGGSGAASRAGITFRTGGTLHIEQTRINGNFTLDRGIGASSGAAALFVNETTIRECAAGIVFDARGAVIDFSRFEDNAGDGFIAESGDSRVTINGSISAGNSFGFIGEGELNLERCVAANNSTAGIQAGTDAVMRVSNSTIVDNQIGLSAPTNGQLLSRGNNTVEGNASNGAFTGTFPAN
jgi:Right handed beta helix region